MLFILCVAAFGFLIWGGRKLWFYSLSSEKQEAVLLKRKGAEEKHRAKSRAKWNQPPRMFFYGVGGTNNLPNPEYIAWHIRKYGCAPQMDRDDGYDGFL